jgi:hypothetical protein
LLLLRICTAWANIARSTPALWDTVTLFPRTEGFEHLFDSYLARSQSRGLTLTLTGQFDEDSCALLCAHAHRMQQLGSDSTMLPAASMNLKALKFSPDGKLDLMAVLRMMRASPGLVECTLIGGYHDDPRADSLTLPFLQSLTVGEDPYVSDIHILKYLSVPALHTLTISSIDLDMAVLISFLARSEAPLQSLRIDPSDTEVAPQLYVRLLNLVPTLTCLWLPWNTSSDCILFLNLLGGSPDRFLPQLRNLTILTAQIDGLEFNALYGFLSARGSQIKCFRFIHEGYAFITPPPDVLHTLRQLAAECGMKIYFGSTYTDWI